MSVKQDVRTIAGKSVSVPLSATATMLSVTADGMGTLEKGVKSAPGIVKAILSLPFSARKGMLIQDGVSEKEATERAYKYVTQPLAATIEQVGVGSGKLLADLLKEEAE